MSEFVFGVVTALGEHERKERHGKPAYDAQNAYLRKYEHSEMIDKHERTGGDLQHISAQETIISSVFFNHNCIV